MTNALLRETVWFPDIDKSVKMVVKHCLPCQECTYSTNKEQLKMTVFPKEPWKEVSIDLCEPFKTGECILVIIDDYSRYPEIEILKR